VPLHGKAVWRAIFQKAGCHIFSDGDDFVCMAGGYLLYHTASAVPRRLVFADGKNLDVEARKPMTWLFDAASGDLIFR
jgi:hypothetical protein